jgi:hypothetical protein
MMTGEAVVSHEEPSGEVENRQQGFLDMNEALHLTSVPSKGHCLKHEEENAESGGV